MKVLYTCDNEGPAVMELEALIGNFKTNGVFETGYRVSEEVIREELESRGWFEGCHDNGRFLIVNFHSKNIRLEPHPDLEAMASVK